jgi:iron complex transport system substrate-binding protein
VLQFDTLLLLGFGPRTPQAADELAMALHPNLARAP